MNGNFSNRRNEYSPQPRLPPLAVKSPTYRDQQLIPIIGNYKKISFFVEILQ